MNVDGIRRAWATAAKQAEIDVRLVAVGPADGEGPAAVRGRTGARWSARLRFEAAFAEALGADRDRVELQWLAPRPNQPSSGDRARTRLGLAPRNSEPTEVVAKEPTPQQRAAGKRPIQAAPSPVPGARKVLAIASGKGGVGKSTVATNLALALRARGLKVGMLDADVYGPSMPTMLGSFSAPTRQNEIFKPPEAHGMPFLSLGLMVNPDQSVIWRGPMVQRMVRDMLQKTAWPGLDVLVVDLPPGTGDVQLTLVQRALLHGAVVVTTPQDIALIDAARGLQMFRKMGVPVLGIVENMAEWSCPACGETSHPFGHGGGERESARLEVPFLGRIPLESAVREAADAGAPIVLSRPESRAAAAFVALAERVAADLDAE